MPVSMPWNVTDIKRKKKDPMRERECPFLPTFAPPPQMIPGGYLKKTNIWVDFNDDARSMGFKQLSHMAPKRRIMRDPIQPADLKQLKCSGWGCSCCSPATPVYPWSELDNCPSRPSTCPSPPHL